LLKENKHNIESTYEGLYKKKAVGRKRTFTQMMMDTDSIIYELARAPEDHRWSQVFEDVSKICEMLAKKRVFFGNNYAKYREFGEFSAARYIERVTSPKQWQTVSRDGVVEPKMTKIKSVGNFVKNKLYWWKCEYEASTYCQFNESLDEPKGEDGNYVEIIDQDSEISLLQSPEVLACIIDHLKRVVKNSYYDRKTKRRLYIVSLQTLISQINGNLKILDYVEAPIAPIYVRRAVDLFLKENI